MQDAGPKCPELESHFGLNQIPVHSRRVFVLLLAGFRHDLRIAFLMYHVDRQLVQPHFCYMNTAMPGNIETGI